MMARPNKLQLRRPSYAQGRGTKPKSWTEKIEFLLKIGAAVLSLVTVSVSVWAGYQAYANYRQQVVLQATRELHGEQRKICNRLVNIASKMFSAVDRDELQTLQDEFAETKHGDALMYLEAGVVDASVAVYNRSIIAMQTPDGEDFRKGVQCALAGHPFTLAVACRQMVSDAFLRESGVPLAAIQTTYSMSWKGACKDTDE